MAKRRGRFLYGIRGKIFICTGSVCSVTLAVVIILLLRDMYVHLLADTQAKIPLNTANVAQDIDAQNQHAVTYAETLALIHDRTGNLGRPSSG